MIKQEDITTAITKIESAKTAEELEQLRVRYLGRKSKIAQALRGIGELAAEERAKAGAELNKWRGTLEDKLNKQQQVILTQLLEAESSLGIDLTRPGVGPKLGHLHPVESLQFEVIKLFWQMGFSVASGPEVETEWYCFEALNIGPDHPARDTQDTFYLENGTLPRTHTSSVQIRHMEQHKPPIRIIAPGKVYRNEDEDATHLWAFRQVEGLVVDENITLADLKGTLITMLKGLFGDETELKLLPNYFPYTEPSMEMHARIKGSDKWLELGGAGMVHPQVLRNVGIDPEVYSGFAFGFGLERITAIKYGISDIRDFWRPNLKFLEQF